MRHASFSGATILTMRRTLHLLGLTAGTILVAACTGDAVPDAGSADGGVGIDAGDATCGPGNWDSVAAIPYDRACEVDSDCAIVLRHDCTLAGGLQAGVSASDAARYREAVAGCEATVRPFGCGRSAQFFYDDGLSYQFGSGAYTPVVHCLAHTCVSGIEDEVVCDRYRCVPASVCGGACTMDTVGLRFVPGCARLDADAGAGCGDPAHAAGCFGTPCSDVDGGFTCACS